MAKVTLKDVNGTTKYEREYELNETISDIKNFIFTELRKDNCAEFNNNLSIFEKIKHLDVNEISTMGGVVEETNLDISSENIVSVGSSSTLSYVDKHIILNKEDVNPEQDDKKKEEKSINDTSSRAKNISTKDSFLRIENINRSNIMEENSLDLENVLQSSNYSKKPNEEVEGKIMTIQNNLQDSSNIETSQPNYKEEFDNLLKEIRIRYSLNDEIKDFHKHCENLEKDKANHPEVVNSNMKVFEKKENSLKTIKIIFNGKIINDSTLIHTLSNKNDISLVYLFSIDNSDNFSDSPSKISHKMKESKKNKHEVKTSKQEEKIEKIQDFIDRGNGKASENRNDAKSFNFDENGNLISPQNNNNNIKINSSISFNGNTSTKSNSIDSINSNNQADSNKSVLGGNTELCEKNTFNDLSDDIFSNSIENTMKIEVFMNGNKVKVDPTQTITYKNKMYLITKRTKRINLILAFREVLSTIKIDLVIKLSAILALFITGNKSFAIILLSLILLRYLSKFKWEYRVNPKNSSSVLIVDVFVAFLISLFCINQDRILKFECLDRTKSKKSS
ncbi:hypothetical protein EDEG_01404 [Edhazardia aedis USNM 41457]|uniref:Ubiquitin-like domain-containing protein n=1 Tax=Edhazardia aedis (strain USNM 41457) TaxID=1003232 RepID=J8ZXC6_EDHAE|nr:hypothetical protein EDEG_01404 [Edhazardia aedis USNM 41457]|eukprot:EJW04338.1 hypothetical protein EDEG_01404 [Edhazardia aedis USNM 41457]